MNLVKKTKKWTRDIDYKTTELFIKILFDTNGRDFSDRSYAFWFLYWRALPFVNQAMHSEYYRRSCRSYLKEAVSAIERHFDLNNPDFYKRFFVPEKTNPIVHDCFNKIIDSFGRNPKEDVIVRRSCDGKAITNRFDSEKAEIENMEIIENKILGYQLRYEKNVNTDILCMMKYIFEKLKFYTKYNTFSIYILPTSNSTAAGAYTDKSVKECVVSIQEKWNMERPLVRLFILDLLIHEFCHITHKDSLISNGDFNKRRASEFRAESWIPQNFKLIAKVRFYGKIINFGSQLNNTTPNNTFYPAPFEDYILSRTMYKENFDNLELFYTDLYNVHPALLEMDNVLMNLCETNKDKMFIAPQLIENIDAAKREYKIQQYEYGFDNRAN